jgi:hypothetical protein
MRALVAPELRALFAKDAPESSIAWEVALAARELGRREMVTELTRVEMALDLERSMVAALEDVVRATARLREKA